MVIIAFDQHRTTDIFRIFAPPKPIRGKIITNTTPFTVPWDRKG